MKAMTLEAFLAWEAEQDRPHEFLNGQPVPIFGSTQQRSLLIADIICGLKIRYRGTDRRIYPRMRMPLPELLEVRYPDIIVDGGLFRPDALEPTNPEIVIDIGRNRDWSSMSGVRYYSVPVDADAETVLCRV